MFSCALRLVCFLQFCIAIDINGGRGRGKRPGLPNYTQVGLIYQSQLAQQCQICNYNLQNYHQNSILSRNPWYYNWNPILVIGYIVISVILGNIKLWKGFIFIQIWFQYYILRFISNNIVSNSQFSISIVFSRPRKYSPNKNSYYFVNMCAKYRY